MKYVTDSKDLLETPHIAVIVFSSIYIEGDERSRTNPGHGYPGHHQSVVEYIALSNEAELAKWIEDNNNRQTFRVIQAIPKKVETKLQVTLR